VTGKNPWVIGLKFEDGATFAVEAHYAATADALARKLFKSGAVVGVDVGQHTFKGFKVKFALGEKVDL
jgi:hypothetical protein